MTLSCVDPGSMQTAVSRVRGGGGTRNHATHDREGGGGIHFVHDRVHERSIKTIDPRIPTGREGARRDSTNHVEGRGGGGGVKLTEKCTFR